MRPIREGFSFSRDNIDGILALAGAVCALMLIAFLQIRIGNPAYTITAVLAFLACAAYLFLKWRQKLLDFSSILNVEAKPSILLLADIVFFALFTYNLWVFAFRPEPYVRPLEYFISIAAMSAILAAKILFLPAKNSWTSFTLFQIILIGLSLEWTVLLMFPDIVGMDTWVHRLTTIGWVASGRIDGGIYQSLPIMHLTVGATSIITALNYKMAAMFSISLLQVVCDVLFIFLIGRLVFNAKVGMLAALFAGIANWHIFFGYWTIPNTLGATFLFIILYLVLKLHKDRVFAVIPLLVLLMVALLLTHTIATLWLAILLFTFWLCFVFYNKFFKERSATLFILVIAVLFTLATFGWWTFGSGTTQTLLYHIRQGFAPSAGLTYAPGAAESGLAPISVEPSESLPPEVTPPEAISPEATPPEVVPPVVTPPGVAPPEVVPPVVTPPGVAPPEVVPPEAIPPSYETLSTAPLEFLFNSLGMILFFALSFIGCFYMLSRRFGSSYSFLLVVAGILVLGIGYFPMLIGRSVIEHRWWYLAELLLSIPLAVTISLLFGLSKKNYLKAGIVIVLVFILTFLSIMGFPSNQTNRTFSENQVVRFALTASESQAMQTVATNYEGTIGVDGFYTKIQFTPELLAELRGNLEWIQSCLLTKDFSQASSRMFLIREEIVNHPFGTGSGSYFRLNYDPRQVFTEEGLQKIYDCGSVSGFIKD